jgi:hypothetical protein
MRERAINAVDVLNDLVGDLITGTNVLRDYRAQHQRNKLPTELVVGIQKMCISHLVMGACKFIEFFEHFHDILDADDRTSAKALVREFNSRGMVEFRNTVVGHIWDKKKGRPLLLSEITQHLERLTNKDLVSFLDWINKLEVHRQPDSVVGTVEKIRSNLVEAHSIQPDEVIGR